MEKNNTCDISDIILFFLNDMPNHPESNTKILTQVTENPLFKYIIK